MWWSVTRQLKHQSTMQSGGSVPHNTQTFHEIGSGRMQLLWNYHGHPCNERQPHKRNGLDQFNQKHTQRTHTNVYKGSDAHSAPLISIDGSVFHALQITRNECPVLLLNFRISLCQDRLMCARTMCNYEFPNRNSLLRYMTGT